MSNVAELKREIDELKTQLKTREMTSRRKRGLLTERQLYEMSVPELRKLVKSNFIFRGISKLKKKQIIDKIVDSPWFEHQPRNFKFPSGDPPPIPPRKQDKEKKTIKIKIKKKAPPPAPPPTPAPPPPPPPAPPISPPKKEKTIDLSKESKEVEEVEPNIHNIHLKFKKGEKMQKKLDLGHTIVNIFVGSNQHPDYPIPQSLVRSALNAQNLPENKQKEMAQFLRQEAKNTPVHENVPQPVSIVQEKKWAPVRTTPPQKPQTIKSVSKGKKARKKALRKELEGLQKSSGFNVDFKKKLENKLAEQQGLPLPHPDLEEQEDED